jgi:mono/diheme cytochrome c family protein
VLVTATGLAFTSDVGGNLYTFDAQSGQQYWTRSTGSSVVAPLSAYSLDGTEYIAATGQVALANAVKGSGESAAPVASSKGSAPYTKQQVAQGRDLYAQQCAACHGTTLQGISAPALTGPAFAHSHLTASQLRGAVTQRMPLTAPGSLRPEEYASIMAFLLDYDCVKPAGNDQQPFPTTDLPALQQVALGGTTCAPP